MRKTGWCVISGLLLFGTMACKPGVYYPFGNGSNPQSQVQTAPIPVATAPTRS